MTRRFPLAVLGPLLVCFVASAELPVRAQSDCLSAGCHADIAGKPRKHSALQGDCTDCHEATEAADAACKSGNTFEVAADPDLCLGCHEGPPEAGRHEAVEGGCLSCHDPHGGADASLLKAPLAETCGGCHEVWEGGAGPHPPVAGGECTSCHRPHASEHPSLLIESPEALCGQCHDVGLDRAHVHAAVADGCGTCHAVHGSQHPRMLVEAPKALCLQCHEGGAAGLGAHLPVASGRCVGCHEPHASEEPTLLRRSGKALCLSCHGPAADAPGASRRRISLAGTTHMPAAEGCSDCHAAHGSANEHLLVKSASTLCFECHEPIEGAFLHSAVRLGRCTGCHEPHAAPRASLLRAEGAALCFECHADDVTGRTSVHAPVADGECRTCHEAHQAETPRLLVMGSPVETCRACHEVGGEAEVPHAALERYGCGGCHDPHGSDAAQLLLGGVPALCVNCHPGQADGTHVFTGFDGTPHPVAGVADPVRRPRDLDCTGCHDPHGTNHPKLWYEGDAKMQMCARCHDRYRRRPGDSAAVTPEGEPAAGAGGGGDLPQPDTSAGASVPPAGDARPAEQPPSKVAR